MEELQKYTVNALQNILRERGLSVSYRTKLDLINRILGIVEDEAGKEGARSESPDPLTEEEKTSTEDSDSIKSNCAEQEMTAEEKVAFGNSFVFRDVEESLETFSGESGKSVKSWLKDFKDIAAVCQWNDVQKYLYARRLLRGAARAAVEASTGVHSWNMLEETLQSEFDDTPTSLSIHKSLENRKKKVGETFLEYIYAMKQLANRGSVDEESLVAYIIAGIADDVQNKVILYGAKTLEELKQKMKAYEVMKAQQRTSCSYKKPPTTKMDRNIQNPKRCYNCGCKTHLTGSCPDKNKGAKCFNCGSFGHMASSCRQPKPERAGTSRFVQGDVGNQVSTISVPDLSVLIRFGQGEYRALVDTGSGVTLVRKSVVDKSRICAAEKGPSIILTGFGQSLKRTLCSILTEFEINGDSYDVKCHVVPDNWITSDILIGLDIIRLAELHIENGELSFSKAKVVQLGEEPDFLKEIDVVQLMQACSYENLNEVDDISRRQEIREMIARYSPRKQQESCIKMQIRLEDGTPPIYFKPRRLAPKEKNIVREQVEEWLKDGIIRPSCSDFASPVVLANKKDGGLRLCVDYRKLNRYIVKDRYPLPIMEDVLEDLYAALVFTTLDLRNGFFHVDVDEPSKRYTAFLTCDGQFEFNKAPFGLCNSPAVFQRFINTAFQSLIKDKTILLYMDDIIIPSSSEAENIEKLKRTLSLAEEYGFVIKWEKCKFLKRSVEFLGHIIEQGSIQPSRDKTTAVRNFPVPQNIRDVQSFLGLTGFFRKFIQDYSIIAKPLTDLIKKDVKFKFGRDERDSFELLKERLSSKPVLKLFNPQLETELHSDASKIGYGAILLQKHLDVGKFYPVFYLSFKSTEAEQRYSSYELEVLAIVKSLKRLRHYLLGMKFTIYTDCKAFELTMRKKELNSRIARWALLLEEFDCKVLHRSGSNMRHVDTLSRYPSVMTAESEILLRVKQAQKDDDFCRLIRKCLEQGGYEDYLLRNDVLYKLVEGHYLLVVPNTLQKGIITSIHEQGHINARKVETMMRQEYYIPGLLKKIQRVLQNCVPCILAARKMGKPEGFLNPIEKVDQPLHTYHIDHLGPLASTAKQYKYIFAVIDAFTKFSWIYPVKSTTADEVLRRLELQSEVFGDPRRIIADRGTAFTSTTFQSYCENRKIDLVFITTGVPRGNGQVERLNQIIINALSKMSVADPSKWFKHVPQLQRILNSTYSRSTGRTPFELMFGVKMSCPEQIELSRILEEEINAEFENEREIIRQEAKKQINKIQEENRRYSRRKRKEAKTYKPGDLVAIRRIQFTPGAKLFPKFLGPYEVTAAKGNDRYDVKKIGSHERPNISSSTADLMKPWSNLAEKGYSSETDEFQDGRMWESDDDNN